MSLYRRANGRFIKKSHFIRNKEAHKDNKQKCQITGSTTDHTYAAVISSKDNLSHINSDKNQNTDVNIALEECVIEDSDFILEQNDYVGVDWKDVRVVVDLGAFFSALRCRDCSLPLNLSRCNGFHAVGVSGYVYISCSNPACELINRISLGKGHKLSSKGQPILDVNSKLPLGEYSYYEYLKYLK